MIWYILFGVVALMLFLWWARQQSAEADSRSPPEGSEDVASARKGDMTSPRQRPGATSPPPRLSAKELLSHTSHLQKSDVGWKDGLRELKPRLDTEGGMILEYIIGHHQFAPRYLPLNIIMDGCQKALDSDGKSDATEALRRAKRMIEDFVQ